MASYCCKCKHICALNETVMTCEGFCEGLNRYHARCVGVSVNQGDACSHYNIMWMCDECRDFLKNLHFRKTINVVRSLNQPAEAELKQLKSDVKKMNETINSLVETMSNVNSSPNASTQSETNSKTTSDEILSPSPSVLSSTRKEIIQQQDTLKLHVSNISTDATEDEVFRMVAAALGSSEIHTVRCLVPAWKDVSSMDFISFKVEVDVRYRAAALKTSTWPKGIRCREFVDYTNTTWTPTRLASN